ncbi:MAG: hypothetical protein ACXWV5_07215 [Flavitalea sp.]
MKKIKIVAGFCTLVLVMLLSSCSKPVVEKEKPKITSPYKGYSIWLIKKNNHYPETGSYARVSGSTIQFKTVFDSSAIYKTKLATNQNDINKLYGAADCGTHHQDNSARFGWRWNGKTVEIFAYNYINKARKFVKLGDAAIGQENTYSISTDSKNYIFKYNDKITRLARHCATPAFNGYLLYPYFGGDEPAPHDIRIHIRVLK